MQSQEIRQSFIDFFRGQGHAEVASAPLVPHGDPTLLFVNAGMVQFKDAFLGQEEPVSSRVVTAQKCLRVSGKHNDLENVGPSPRHHTFFEMLGNFSFGDYFKEEAITMAWELVSRVWELPSEHLFATVFEEDDEAEELWRKISGLPAERVLRCGAKDNFWAMGETGPCGPCSEIFADSRPELPKVPFDEGNESGRYVEIWNLVFMQFQRDDQGRSTPLPKPSIDTGSGLERVTAVMQGKRSNYDTDLFQPLLRAAAALAQTEYGKAEAADLSLRVVADHLRATSFLLADGIIPGPEGRGYVLRRLLRRAVRHGMRLGFEEPFMHRLVPVLGEVLGHHYTELEQTQDATVATIREEEEKYLSTLASGARRVQEAIDRTKAAGGSVLDGEELFRLYDTYGQELDAVREIAEEEQLQLDVEGFEQLLEQRRRRSRDATGELQKRLASLREALYGAGEPGATRFEGYGQDSLEEAEVLRLAQLTDDHAGVAVSLGPGQEGVAVLDRSVFYAESGGQVGDRGTLSWPGGSALVSDTQKDGAGVWFHFLRVAEGSSPLAQGSSVSMAIDSERRRGVERHHTATHLLHAALRQELGTGVRQAGSLVAEDRLRFDFTHASAVPREALQRIEDQVNHWVRQAVPTEIQVRAREEAIAAGAMALFGEKYGDEVRTVEIPGFSLELCGGCHVVNSGQIGLVQITGERGVASGVRRLEAVVGPEAEAMVRQRAATLTEVAGALAAPPDRLVDEVSNLKARLKALDKELAELRRQLVAGGGGDAELAEVQGVKLLAREVPKAPTGELRNMADTLRDKLGSGVVVVATRDEAKVGIVVTVTSDLKQRLPAGRLVGRLAELVGGRGGGRPDFAQAGGKEPDKLPEMLAAVPGLVEELLAAG